jgi:hypothetical protein
LAVKDLGLSGTILQSVLMEYIVSMKLSDSHFIAIESPFRLDVDGSSFSLSPEEKPDEVLESLNRLVGDTIEEAPSRL